MIKIYLDIDDTLLHWTEGFLKYCQDKGIELYKDALFFGIPYKQYDQLIRDYNKSHHFSQLKYNTQHITETFFDKHDVDMCLMTCCGIHKDTINHRDQNLRTYFNKIPDEIHYLDFFDAKAEHIRNDIEEWEKPVLIDDSQSQVVNFWEEFKYELKDHDASVIWLRDHRYSENHPDWYKKEKQIKELPNILIIDQYINECYLSKAIQQAKQYIEKV